MTRATRLQEKSAALIAAHGASVTYTHITATSYNKATGVATPTTVPATVFAIVEDFKGDTWNGQLVKLGDKKFTFGAPMTNPPAPGGKITSGGLAYTIAKDGGVKTTQYQSTPIIYEVRAERG